MMQRRSFLGAVLASFAAPAIAKSGVLMPVKTIAVPSNFVLPEEGVWTGVGAEGTAGWFRFEGPRINLFDAAGALLVTIPMGNISLREFDRQVSAHGIDYGRGKVATFDGGSGKVLVPGTAERFELAGAGEFNTKGAVGPSGLVLNDPVLREGSNVNMLQLAVARMGRGV